MPLHRSASSPANDKTTTTLHGCPTIGRLHRTTIPESWPRTPPFHHPPASSPNLAKGEPGTGFNRLPRTTNKIRVMHEPMKHWFISLAISMANDASFGCSSASKLPNVRTLKKYQ
uniref:Uncharacterized protein n=1 Tax=Oryza rufipogon TaxID=4529 RepID=A0A0E0Q3E5_ORYRU